jgi:hypothetical protein
VSESHEDGCLCGQVRYRIQGPIDSVVHCHCDMCRRWSGAVAMTWITVPLDRFEIAKGELAAYRSSSRGERRSCPACASQIAFWSSQRPGEIDITLGSLDCPEMYPANAHTWTSARLPWLHLDEHLPAYETALPEGGE